mmetsp:Transcript_1976/g.2768  ORF Transcript_1976/g.2768 Transcript_1976/m.2768 type:complete len:1084 (-) Transcript_1976:233-3484(-)|eukprot:CAMPEP_0178913962 /NCGR_PEP_ID=MMETSP0786-20121207/11142_1 /TAXON_ID=186022 /ORGANISM="Thalassionema frauenfeldii, Strain CCMP 1798" /LENGTH=1083 /DNA_ID=CAMNT_0020586779 /DNA_START=333 /DNA_END=3584 /DNA_ORIENTATION=+
MTLWVACMATSRGRVSVAAFTPAISAAARPFSRLPFVNSFARRQKSSASSILHSSTLSSSSVDLEKSLDVTHPAFDVVKKDVVQEYGAYCTLYRHKKSGAELMSVATDDDNKVFGITFRTPPSDSTGVPHILEHSVLCGSRKYKTKDPFVQLLQGSLQTFLNAFTYPDRTCYVVASQNMKDFYNLVNVYTDAVFYPRAVKDPMVHAQEGWHLELEEKDDPLTYKGVVYNEMKGVYSSSDSLLMRESQRSIFPDNTYSVDSGGDPAVIPELSYEQFVDFHGKFYHPANSRIYFFGDDDVYTRLELMDEYLKDFGPSPESKPASEIEWQKKTIVEPVKFVHPYPAGEDQEETNMVMVNWLMNESPLTSTEELTLNILDHLLMGTTSSILRKTLMESGLGAAITGGGLSDELLQATFSVGLKGVKREQTEEVEKLVLDTLQKVAKDGFSDDAIAASMNTIEFQLREFNTGSFPKGLSFMLGSMSKWIYDESPTDGLRFEKPLAELKEKIEESQSQVFKDMIQDLLVKNTHRTTIEMVPSKTLEMENLEDEEKRLAAIKAGMSEEQLDEVISKTKELKRIQASEDTPEERATIPSLSLPDLKREVTEYPIDVSEDENESGVTVVRHELLSTSGIAYAGLLVDLSMVALEDVPLLQLFTRMMTQTGTSEYDPVALTQRIGMYTGGISTSIMTTPVKVTGVEANEITDCDKMVTKLVIKGKATSDRIDELFSLYISMLTDANLDSQSKVIEMLKESKAGIESSIQGSGHSYALQRMRARYTAAGYIDEKMGGISYLDSVKQLLDQAENDWPTLLERLQKLRKTILQHPAARDGMLIDVTGDQKVLDTIKPSLDKLLKDLPGQKGSEKLQDFYSEDHPWVVEAKKDMATNAPMVDEGFIVPTQVSYVGKGGRLFDKGDRISGTASVVARYLRTGYLWDHVRVIGGAYGGMNMLAEGSGFFGFVSYRDPNLSKTLDVYDAAADALIASAEELENDSDALATAIIGAVGDMDGALSPDQKGWAAFTRWLIRETPEARQRRRDEILDTKASDFKDFAERLRSMKNPSSAVVSSKAAFETAEKEGKTFSLTNVL